MRVLQYCIACSLAWVIKFQRFAQKNVSLCSRLRSLVVCYDKEVCWICGWETKGKGRVCVESSV
jgi:hypothetical protein